MDNSISAHDLMNTTFILSVLLIYIGIYMLLFSTLTKIDHKTMNIAKKIIINLIFILGILLTTAGVIFTFTY